MYSHMVECTEAAMGALKTEVKTSAELDAATEMESLTLAVIATCAFGVHSAEVADAVEALQTYFQNVLRFTRGQGIVAGYR